MSNTLELFPPQISFWQTGVADHSNLWRSQSSQIHLGWSPLYLVFCSLIYSLTDCHHEKFEKKQLPSSQFFFILKVIKTPTTFCCSAAALFHEEKRKEHLSTDCKLCWSTSTKSLLTVWGPSLVDSIYPGSKISNDCTSEPRDQAPPPTRPLPPLAFGPLNSVF